MNILIVGNTSMVGKRLIERFNRNGNTIYTAGRDKCKSDIWIDLETMGMVPIDPKMQIDVIVHCAASFFGDDFHGCMKNERINSIGSLLIGQLAHQLQCKHLIYLSSISSYAHVDNENYGSYGISKKHGQDFLEMVCRSSDIKFTSLLASQLYDARGEAKKHQPFFYRILDQAHKGLPITLYGNLDVVRNYLFVDDLVDIIERVVANQTTGIYSCVFPRSYKVSEVAGIAYEVFGQSGSINFDSSKAGLKKIHVPDDYYLLYDDIGYSPQTDLSKGISLIKDALY